ncbi:MAG: phage head spike fiber domain-containing protein [Woeseiaceae bacterium]
MKTETENFRTANDLPNLEPRYVAALSFSDAAPKPEQNLLLYSEQLQQTVWVATPVAAGLTRTANTDVAPDGNTTADKLDDTNTGFLSQYGVLQSYTLVNQNLRYRFSVFILKNAVDRTTRFPCIGLHFTDGVDTDLNYLGIDTSNGQYQIITSESDEVAASVEDYSSTWWRVHFWARGTDTGYDTAQVRIYPAYGASLSWVGSAAASGANVFWGAQLTVEAAEGSYIVTAGTNIEGDTLRALNLLTYSEQLDNADWAKSSDVVVTANDDDAPDGTTTADLVDLTVAGFNKMVQQANLDAVVGRTYLASIFIKKDSIPRTTRFIGLHLVFGPSVFSYHRIAVDTMTGEASIDNANGDPAMIGGVSDHSADYWRVWIRASAPAGKTEVTFQLWPSWGSGADWSITSQTGSVHAWGAQISESSALINYRTTTAAALFEPQTADIDEYLLTSHADGQVPASHWSWDRLERSIVDISGQTQKISPDKAQHTIGSIKIQLADRDGELSARIRERLVTGEGLRRKRIRLYKGHESLTSWDDYSLRFTYLVDDVSYQDGVYTLTCSDVQRTEKTEIFDRHQGVLTSTVNSTALSIPITIADAAEKFPLLEHDANYQSDASKTVGYIQIDDEIIRHTGWSGSSLVVDGASGRGALNTTAATHTVTASVDDQKKKVVEYIYIEMAAPRLIYSLLTGKIPGQGGNMPAHWNVGISTDFVRLSDYQAATMLDLWDPATNTGRMAKIQGAEIVQAKAYIEKEILLWLGAFMPVYSDGALGLKRFQNILPGSSFDEQLRPWDIVKYGPLMHDQKAVINNMVIQYNFIPVLERYTKTVQLIDSDSISKYGKAELLLFQFQVLFSGRHALHDVYQYFDQLRDRYAAPPERIKLDVMPEFDRLDVGDTVRTELDQVHDYNTGGSMDRTLEIQQIRTNWKTGLVTLDLFGGVERASKNAIASASVMNDSFYTAAGTELSTVLTISAGAVTANGTLNGDSVDHANAIFYYDGDLTINSGVTVTINKNVQLRVKGFLTINGTIDGAGQGNAGATSSAAARGTLGTQGRVGISKTYPGIDIKAKGSGFDAFVPVITKLSLSVGTGPVFNSFNGLNIVNPDGLELEGVPRDLQGTSGASGHGALEDGSYQAAGGAGGDGGAGLVVVARGVAFGGSGSLDLSGDDGGSPSSFTENETVWGMVCYAGAGQGGFPGAVLFLLDGNVESPLVNSVQCLEGDTPIPTVDHAMPFNLQQAYDSGLAGDSVCWWTPFAQLDYAEGNVGIFFINDAENGYTWTPADEIKEAANLAFQLN